MKIPFRFKNTISNKLLLSGSIILLVVALMIVSSQLVLRLFKNTSNKLVTEYRELDAIQDFKISLGNLVLPLNQYILYNNTNSEQDFNDQLIQAQLNLKYCREVLTKRHDHTLFHSFENIIDNVDSLASVIFNLEGSQNNEIAKSLLVDINQNIREGLININIFLVETKDDIDKYVKINKTTIRHSTITIFSLGITATLFLVIVGWLIIGNITKPISKLVTATKLISKGDRSATVNINSKDEFYALAQSFNAMTESLEMTTVSRNYFNNILENMFNSLLVTDDSRIIKSVNKSTLNLLNYEQSELIGQSLDIIFNDYIINESQTIPIDKELNIFQNTINNQNHLKSKSGVLIPVLISCTILKNKKNESDGLIVVAHDLTERNSIEKKLEQLRKERLIEINEAQEEERIRIATDLHDGLGQMLTGISYSIQELVSDISYDKSIADQSTFKIRLQIDNAIQEAKNLAHNLIPMVLKDFGLVAAIENLISKANEIYNTRFTFNVFDFNERIDPKLEKVLYRICQESLNNIIKHAKAKKAFFQIFRQEFAIVLVIEDDGIGFDQKNMKMNKEKSGIGLISIRERILAFDGKFTLNSSIGEGTELIVEIPCYKSKHNENG